MTMPGTELGGGGDAGVEVAEDAVELVLGIRERLPVRDSLLDHELENDRLQKLGLIRELGAQDLADVLQFQIHHHTPSNVTRTGCQKNSAAILGIANSLATRPLSRSIAYGLFTSPLTSKKH